MTINSLFSWKSFCFFFYHVNNKSNNNKRRKEKSILFARLYVFSWCNRIDNRRITAMMMIEIIWPWQRLFKEEIITGRFLFRILLNRRKKANLFSEECIDIQFTLTESFLLIRGRAFSGSRRKVISSCLKNEFIPGTNAWGLNTIKCIYTVTKAKQSYSEAWASTDGFPSKTITRSAKYVAIIKSCSTTKPVFLQWRINLYTKIGFSFCLKISLLLPFDNSCSM